MACTCCTDRGESHLLGRKDADRNRADDRPPVSPAAAAIVRAMLAEPPHVEPLKNGGVALWWDDYELEICEHGSTLSLWRLESVS